MWKSGEKSIQFWGKIRKKFIEMWKWAQKKVATLVISLVDERIRTSRVKVYLGIISEGLLI